MCHIMMEGNPTYDSSWSLWSHKKSAFTDPRVNSYEELQTTTDEPVYSDSLIHPTNDNIHGVKCLGTGLIVWQSYPSRHGGTESERPEFE